MKNPDPNLLGDLNTDQHSVAAWIAKSLVQRGVRRIFGLQGGHIQPIWDFLAQQGVQIIDVRDEGAAVHMAHAHAELTGELGVRMATAGPGVTNCVSRCSQVLTPKTFVRSLRASTTSLRTCRPVPPWSPLPENSWLVAH